MVFVAAFVQILHINLSYQEDGVCMDISELLKLTMQIHKINKDLIITFLLVAISGMIYFFVSNQRAFLNFFYVPVPFGAYDFGKRYLTQAAALSAYRPYRKALSPSEARKNIIDNSGTHFDPAVVRIFDMIYPSLLRDGPLFPSATLGSSMTGNRN